MAPKIKKRRTLKGGAPKPELPKTNSLPPGLSKSGLVTTANIDFLQSKSKAVDKNLMFF